MGRLIHPVRDQNSKQYLRPKACLHHHKIKRLLLSKSNQYEKGGPIAHNNNSGQIKIAMAEKQLELSSRITYMFLNNIILKHSCCPVCPLTPSRTSGKTNTSPPPTQKCEYVNCYKPLSCCLDPCLKHCTEGRVKTFVTAEQLVQRY